eukprot:6459998-Amphidinium_carterae.1
MQRRPGNIDMPTSQILRNNQKGCVVEVLPEELPDLPAINAARGSEHLRAKLRLDSKQELTL